MKTQFFHTDINSNEVFEKCGKILRDGGLVSFPTETVYGLGGNALEKTSVGKIYSAKGRPSDNPLIVHLSSIEDLYKVSSCITEKGKALAEKFWPGPITLIFKKNDNVPYEVTGGLDTVAVRVPSNEIAINLIKTANVPVAAPSANVSGRPSPTTANHVRYDLDGKIDAIIDGGNCTLGIESTIVDVSVEPPILLRPGSITVDMIESVIGKIDIDLSIVSDKANNGDFKPKAPGMKYKHYSPKGEIIILNGEEEKIINFINGLEYENIEGKIGILTVDEHIDYYRNSNFFIISLGSKNNLDEIASKLFSSFREFDDNNIKKIYAEAFEPNGVALAIMNRLKKAAGFNIINV